MHRAALPLIVCALVGAPVSVAAQAGNIASGDRVRITSRALGHGQEFTLVAVRGDTLQLRRTGAANDELLAFSAIERLEVNRGRRARGDHVVRRAGYGAAIGAIAGGVLLGATDNDNFFADSRGGSAMIGALVGGAIGGAIGLLNGVVSGRERWETVRLR